MDRPDYDGAHECTDNSIPVCAAGATYYCTQVPCFGRTGTEVLNSLSSTLGFEATDTVAWRVAILISYGVLFKLLTMLRLSGDFSNMGTSGTPSTTKTQIVTAQIVTASTMSAC
eukprot:1867557-Prymnesium_polylepis.1